MEEAQEGREEGEVMDRERLILILDQVGQAGVFKTQEEYSEFESYVLKLDEQKTRYFKENQANLSKYFKYKNAFDALFEKVTK